MTCVWMALISEGLMTIVLPDAIAADSFPQMKL